MQRFPKRAKFKSWVHFCQSLMQSTDTPTPPDDEIDLLDLMVVLAENIKLLILGTLLASLIGLALAFAWPSTFESTSILSINKSELTLSDQVIASYTKSTDVLESAAQKIGFEPDISTARRLKKMDKLVEVSVGKGDSPLVTLTTRGPNPEQAQKLNAAIWEKVLPRTAPRGANLERLEQQLTSERSRLASAEALEASTLKQLQGGASSESLSRLYGELLSANSRRQEFIARLEAQIEGLTMESLTQQPTLPELPSKPNKLLIALGVTAVGGMFLLLFVFIRQALRSASQNPEQAKKVTRLRAAFGLN